MKSTRSSLPTAAVVSFAAAVLHSPRGERLPVRARRRRLVATLALLVFARVAPADEIHLKGGGRVSGEIVERTETSLKVDIGAGAITVPLSSVVKIDERESPIGEYRSRAARLGPGDVEAWRNLARWASSEGLAAQAREAFRHVLAALPDDAEANRGLGRIQVDGKWMSESDAYRAQGYVDFEGEWLTPEERDAILAERSASEEAERRALEEEIRAGEEELLAEREREEAERQAWWDERHTTGSGMVYWDWGMGPGIWPSEADEPSGPRNFGE